MDSEFDIIEINPATTHTHTVVFLHGRGDNAQNFIRSLAMFTDSRGRTLATVFPSFRWVFPKAKVSQLSSAPRERWSQWFDNWSVRNFKEREEVQTEGLKDSVKCIRKILNREAATLGGHWDRIILAGISQGGATSVHTMFNLDLSNIATHAEGSEEIKTQGLAAFLGFSCRLPFAGKSLPEMRKVLDLDNVPEHDSVIRNTPILLEHCVDDPLVLVEHGRGLRNSLQDLGAQVTWKEYQNGGHWFNSPAGMDDVVEFIERVIFAGNKVEDTAMDTS